MNGHIIVFLDGLDEAPDRIARGEVAEAVSNAVRSYKKCRFVLTTRSIAFTEGSVLSDFPEYTIAPLDKQGIETFLSFWTDALFLKSLLKSTKEKHLGELKDALSSRLEIRRMAVNPMMLNEGATFKLKGLMIIAIGFIYDRSTFVLAIFSRLFKNKTLLKKQYRGRK
jgi:hypothetical protein